MRSLTLTTNVFIIWWWNRVLVGGNRHIPLKVVGSRYVKGRGSLSQLPLFLFPLSLPCSPLTVWTDFPTMLFHYAISVWPQAWVQWNQTTMDWNHELHNLVSSFVTSGILPQPWKINTQILPSSGSIRPGCLTCICRWLGKYSVNEWVNVAKRRATLCFCLPTPYRTQRHVNGGGRLCAGETSLKSPNNLIAL